MALNYWDEQTARAKAISDADFKAAVARSAFAELGNYFWMVFMTEEIKSDARKTAKAQFDSLTTDQKRMLEGA